MYMNGVRISAVVVRPAFTKQCSVACVDPNHKSFGCSMIPYIQNISSYIFLFILYSLKG